jgi:uncharacterized protein (DUF885 family)
VGPQDDHGAVTPIRDLADNLVHRLFTHEPFLGSSLGVREYDALVPDLSPDARRDFAESVAESRGEAVAAEPDEPEERIIRGAVLAACDRAAHRIEIAAETYTVTDVPMEGPPVLFALAARTALPDEQAATDYLSRLSGAGAWFAQSAQRLRDGHEADRLPVASLVGKAIAWCDRQLQRGSPAALVAPQPPEQWNAAGAWREERDKLIADSVCPGLRAWRELLVELQPLARDDDHAGVWALPGGAELYERCIAVHTTLHSTADELHELGTAAVAELEARAIELGRSIGLPDSDAVRAAVRASSAQTEATAALATAREAVKRAEARAAEIMPPPLPDPCAVEPMPETVAEAGAAPHYTRPRADTGRPGTFWFNTMRATAGVGWDLEAVAFHEAVPGHHSQLARLQRLPDLPMLLQCSVTVHSEGWGLYAERLAEEFGLYSGVQAKLGSVYIELHRAARLVVDTGLHHLGWSRRQARQYLLDHVALPEQFLADETDRYIAWPGQALAYLSGQREILRLREEATTRLGPDFDLPAFHAAILDHGSLPMPVLADAVASWITDRQVS